MSGLGKRLIASAKEARAIARGEMEPARIHVPSDLDVRAIRKATGYTQREFAERYGFSLARLRDWEQGRSRPDSAMRAYLIVISHDAEAVERALVA
jgi:putative transcriptional regulator